MKLSDFLSDIGRPVAYYPKLAHEVGGVKAAVFLCQLIYWHGKQADADGWMFKSVEEWEDETGLTYWEQRGVRRELKKAGLLQEKHRRVEHVVYYRLNLEMLNELWEQAVCKSQTAQFAKVKLAVCKSQTGSLQKSSSLKSITETTTETTPEIARVKTPRASDPEIILPKVTNEQRLTLEKTFTEITGLHPPPNQKEAGKRWWTPLREMIQEANGQSDVVLRAAVKQMKKDGLTFDSPASIHKTFRACLGQRNLSGMKSASSPDPFAALNEMLERQEHENNR